MYVSRNLNRVLRLGTHTVCFPIHVYTRGRQVSTSVDKFDALLQVRANCKSCREISQKFIMVVFSSGIVIRLEILIVSFRPKLMKAT